MKITVRIEADVGHEGLEAAQQAASLLRNVGDDVTAAVEEASAATRCRALHAAEQRAGGPNAPGAAEALTTELRRQLDHCASNPELIADHLAVLLLHDAGLATFSGSANAGTTAAGQLSTNVAAGGSTTSLNFLLEGSSSSQAGGASPATPTSTNGGTAVIPPAWRAVSVALAPASHQPVAEAILKCAATVLGTNGNVAATVNVRQEQASVFNGGQGGILGSGKRSSTGGSQAGGSQNGDDVLDNDAASAVSGGGGGGGPVGNPTGRAMMTSALSHGSTYPASYGAAAYNRPFSPQNSLVTAGIAALGPEPSAALIGACHAVALLVVLEWTPVMNVLQTVAALLGPSTTHKAGVALLGKLVEMECLGRLDPQTMHRLRTLVENVKDDALLYDIGYVADGLGWRRATQALVRVKSMAHHQEPINIIRLVPGRDMLFTACASGRIAMWRSGSKTEDCVLAKHFACALDVFAPRHNLIASAAAGRYAGIAPALVFHSEDNGHLVERGAVERTGRDGHIKLISALRCLPGADTPLYCTGEYSVTDGALASIADVSQADPLLRVRLNTDIVTSLYAIDSSNIISGSRDGSVTAFDIRRGERTHTWQRDSSVVAVDGLGHLLAFAEVNNRVSIFDIRNSSQPMLTYRFDSSVLDVALGPLDGCAATQSGLFVFNTKGSAPLDPNAIGGSILNTLGAGSNSTQPTDYPLRIDGTQGKQYNTCVWGTSSSSGQHQLFAAGVGKTLDVFRLPTAPTTNPNGLTPGHHPAQPASMAGPGVGGMGGPMPQQLATPHTAPSQPTGLMQVSATPTSAQTVVGAFGGPGMGNAPPGGLMGMPNAANANNSIPPGGLMGAALSPAPSSNSGSHTVIASVGGPGMQGGPGPGLVQGGIGPQGPQGPPGPQGPQAPQGNPALSMSGQSAPGSAMGASSTAMNGSQGPQGPGSANSGSMFGQGMPPSGAPQQGPPVVTTGYTASTAPQQQPYPTSSGQPFVSLS